MKQKQETRNRARIEILNYVVEMCTMKYFGENSFSLGRTEHSFHGSHFGEQKPPIGALCSLQSAPVSKYYLSWIREIKEGDSRFDTQYLLESVEDGSLCWWSNVSIWWLPLETTNRFEQWQWTDKQWELWDKWQRACKKRDAYIVLPVMPEFTEDGGVILRTRTRFGLDESRPERKFDNWNKLTQKQMLEFYDYAVELRKTPKQEAQ